MTLLFGIPTVEVLIYVLLFISGLFVGSFLNLVADRLRSEEPIGGTARSQCNSCKTKLGIADLVPVLSYIFLGGKCRYCKSVLSLYYPISEILTAGAFVLVGWFTAVTRISNPYQIVSFLFLLIVMCGYIIIFLSDAKYMIIPNRVIYPLILFALVYICVVRGFQLYNLYYLLKNDSFGKYLLEAGLWTDRLYMAFKEIGASVLCGLGIAGFFIALIMITKGRGMGFGDVKLGFFIGFFNGYPYGILGIFLGFLYGAVISILLVLLRLKKMKDHVAFGPFLILGSITAYMWGRQFMDWYFGLFR